MIHPLLPHDALLLIERSEPDVVLIETSALTVGQPWGMAGDPSVGDYGRRLVEIIKAAHAIGRPAALWWKEPRDRGAALIPMERLFDLLITGDGAGSASAIPHWSTGVQLARFNPLGAAQERPCRPVLVDRVVETVGPSGERSWDVETHGPGPACDVWLEFDGYPYHPAASELPDRMASRVTRWFTWADAPDVYRSHGLFVAPPDRGRDPEAPILERTLAELACGARIVSCPDPALADSLSDWVTWVDRLDDVDAATAGAVPLARAEIRSLMRSLYERHATALALRRLMHHLGSSARLMATRDVCAVIRVDPESRGDRIVDDILRQRHRPIELLLAGEPSDQLGAVIDELHLAGIAARIMPSTDDPSAILAEASTRTRARWLWPMAADTRYRAEHVLDLMMAAQISGADAVGHIEEAADGFVTTIPGDMAIVSRTAAQRLPDPTVQGFDSWFAAGASLFGLGAPQG